MYTQNQKLKNENLTLSNKLKEKNKVVSSLQGDLKTRKSEITQLNEKIQMLEIQLRQSNKPQNEISQSNLERKPENMKKPTFLDSVDTLNHEDYQFWESSKGKSEYQKQDELKLRDLVKGDQNLWINQIEKKNIAKTNRTNY